MYCPLPFTELRIRVKGDCYICCPQWNNRKSIGNVFETPNLDDIWNSETAQEIRHSMFDQSFRFCNLELCQVGKHRYTDDYKSAVLEQGPSFIALNYDPSCNLFCKMCRDKKIVIPRRQQERLIEFQDNLIKSPYFKDTSMINVTSNGDPFASKVFSHLFKILKYEDFPEMNMRIRTHGLGLTPRNWNRMANVQRMIYEIWISVDASSKETYDIIRRGGKWELLKSNLEFLKSIKSQFNFSLALHFIVQKENYLEIPSFVDFARSYDADVIWFAKVYQGNDMSHEQLQESAVHRPDHRLHSDFLQVMRHPNVLDPHVDWTNMKQFVNTLPDGSQRKTIDDTALPILNANVKAA